MASPRRALLITSSATRLSDFSAPAAVPAAPLADALYSLSAHALVDVATVSGEAVPLDWTATPSNHAPARRLTTDGAAQAKLASPLALPLVAGAAYNIVMVAPSLSAAWDCSPSNPELARVLRECVAAGGVVAGAGDGARALLPLVPAGALVTGPPNADVDAAGAAAMLPYLFESRARAAGCVYLPPAAPGAPLALAAGRVVTGANDASAGAVAREAVGVLTGGAAGVVA